MSATVKGNSRNSGYDRNANDWYQDPRIAIDMLLNVERFDGTVWDPACGGGNIPDACEAKGINVIRSDLVDRGAGAIPMDFLKQLYLPAADHIVTKPPYNLAEEFVTHGLSLVDGKVAVIVRTAFLEGRGRHERLFSKMPPARIWQFAPRISMPPGGKDIPAKGGSVAYCWIVWDHAHQGAPTFGWLA